MSVIIRNMEITDCIDCPMRNDDDVCVLQNLDHDEVHAWEEEYEQYYSWEKLKEGCPLEETAEPKTGEWKYNSLSDKWRCNQCFQSNNKKSNFCPNCGARMEWKDGKEE